MAWTTSASQRARLLEQFAIAGRKQGQYIHARMRRATPRWPQGLALALPIATLGVLAPIVPSQLICAVLITTGAAIILFGIEPPRVAARTSARSPKGSHPAPFRHSQIALEPRRPHPRGASTFAGQPFAVHRRPQGDFATLMARVNHELRTPLNAVIGFSEVMALQMFGPLGNERYAEYVGHIRDSASEVLKSAEDTLALTALMTSSRETEASACTLQHVATDAWAFVSRKAAGRGIDLDMRLGDDLEVLGEPRTLRQIMVNMLSEAITRAAHGERVTLMAVADGELVEIVISVPVERPRASVADTSLSITLARTLLEMQGTSLLEIDGATGGWRAVTVLDRAVQPDFFPGPFAVLGHAGAPALAN